MLAIPLGPFQLSRLIGVGGAGEVWQGSHAAEGVPVAVKVITAARARDPRYREAFENEVRAVAGLEHPGVVVVFDAGFVDEAAEQASMGRMVSGSPYLAMELAGRGSLRTRPPPEQWSELRNELLWLLEILANAHAHGVIHRDLKPGNVLVFDEPAVEDDRGGGSRLRLTDFGLAHASDRAERAIKGTSGTPVFMAPEQFRGQWRDFGPPTDLYAFGCMAFAMASGGPPFAARGLSQLMAAHLTAPLPELEPRLPVPAGFGPWLHRLMRKDPDLRFQRAADAASVLLELGPPVPIAKRRRPPEVPDDDDDDTLIGETLTRSWQEWEQEERGEAPTPVPLKRVARCDRRVPPLPPDWRRHHTATASMRLVGAGLGLYGLRAIPMVGRHAEHDALWRALREAREEGDVRVCLLRGTAGVGKSRLAEWVARRADEVGNAVVVRATHSPGGGAADGLPRMVEAALACIGLERQDLERRIERWLERRGVVDDYEWRALAELVWPMPANDERRSGPKVVRFGGANERYALIHRLLEHLSGHADDRGGLRPIVLWLDDVQWGHDALGLARYLLDRVSTRDVPILVLVTAQEEALQDRPEARAALDELAGHEQVGVYDIAPLQAAERTELVQELLRLEGELAAQVEERTGGNPLFAVQLVGDWVLRGVLAVGRTGFVLREGEHAELPDDIHQLWAGRIEQVLEREAGDARPALEVAALLGNDVDEAEWRGACRVCGLDVPDGLWARLIGRRLALRADAGWSFAHGMLRESLERSAREHGRWSRLHDACATTLEIRYDAGRQPGVAGRLGWHLFHAGRPAEALEPLQRGAVERRATSDYTGAIRLLDLRDEVLAGLGAEPSDARRAEGRVSRAEVLIGQGRLQDAEACALQVVSEGRTHGWTRYVPPALRHAAVAMLKQGRMGEAEALLLECEAAARGVRDEAELARCVLYLGEATRLQGRHDEARTYCRRALKRFAVLDDRRGQADALGALAAVARTVADLDRTERYIREAIPLYESVGGRFGVASLKNTLGDVLRTRDRLEEAEAAYRDAEALLRSLGSPEHYVPMLNLALLLMARKRYTSARRRLAGVLGAMERTGRRGLEGALHAFLVPCAAAEGDWTAFDEHLSEAARLLDATGFVDRDIADAADSGARMAEAAGEPWRAERAQALAEGQWQRLGTKGAGVVEADEP